MDEQILDDIKAVVSYLYKDEQKNFEELDRPDEHIFHSLMRLERWIETGRACQNVR